MNKEQLKAGYCVSIAYVLMMFYTIARGLVGFWRGWPHPDQSVSLIQHFIFGLALLTSITFTILFLYLGPKEAKVPLGVLLLSMSIVLFTSWVFNESLFWKTSARVVGLICGLYSFWDFKKKSL